jgi:hypothetical protein
MMSSENRFALFGIMLWWNSNRPPRANARQSLRAACAAPPANHNDFNRKASRAKRVQIVNACANGKCRLTHSPSNRAVDR